MIIEQFYQFLKDHKEDEDIHFVAHSLGSVILWDILFSQNIELCESLRKFREKTKAINISSITTLGSPLLFLEQFSDIDFSDTRKLTDSQDFFGDSKYKLRWVNVIHSSDIIAYPLGSAISRETPEELFFVDQYVWFNANKVEFSFRSLGEEEAAMAVGAQGAHASYFMNDKAGQATGKIIASNLMCDIKTLSNKRIMSWDKNL